MDIPQIIKDQGSFEIIPTHCSLILNPSSVAFIALIHDGS